MFKKFKKLLVSLMLLLLCTCPAFAEEGVVEDVDNSFTTEDWILLNELMRENPDFVLESEPIAISSTDYYLDKDGNLTEKIVDERGSISPTYMTITIYTGRVYDPGYDTFQIYATAKWNIAPTFRLVDAFGIAWGDNFAVTTHSCTTTYQGIGVQTGKSSLINATANAGIAYSVNVGIAQTLSKVSISAKISKLDTEGRVNVVASYGHTTVSVGTISASITNGPSITYSAGVIGVVDTMAKTTYFDY